MRRKRTSRARRGAVILVALIAVGIVSVMALIVGRMVAARHAVSRAEAAGAEAGWLAESGFDRAAWRLASDPDYQGETWDLSAQTLGLRDPARVEIEVAAVPQQPARRTVRVVADYPDDARWRVRTSIEREIEVTAEKREP